MEGLDRLEKLHAEKLIPDRQALLLGSVAMQLLGYTPLLGVNLLEHGGDKAAAAAFASAFFIARIPVLLFQAVQGTLLPKLAALAGAGRAKDFRDEIGRAHV